MPARRNRVTTGDDYRQIVRQGNRVGGAFCITHAVFPVLHADTASSGIEPRTTLGDPRFGFIISKAVGNAVKRNLIRRRLKAIVERKIQSGFPEIDVVFRVLPACADASFSDLEAEVHRSLDRIENRFAERRALHSVS